jgi:hypothetical protein
MKDIEYEIELINNIIEESVYHGGDAEGHTIQIIERYAQQFRNG